MIRIAKRKLEHLWQSPSWGTIYPATGRERTQVYHIAARFVQRLEGFFLRNVRYNAFVDAQTLEKALAKLPLGPIRYYDRVGSTNDEAVQWAKQGAPNLALVIADEQTHGRGRAGRSWFTPPGAALAFSLVLNPPFPVENRLDVQSLAARLTGLGALAVSQALIKNFSLNAQIKWPNDVLLDDRKVAGVLVEAQWQGSQLVSAILGIGVNIGFEAIPPQGELVFPATCLQASLAEPITRPQLLRAILAQLLDLYEQLDEENFINAWEQNLAYMDAWVKVFSTDDEHMESTAGQVVGLDHHGRLRLRNRSGKIFTVNHGEILLRPMEANSLNRR